MSQATRRHLMRKRVLFIALLKYIKTSLKRRVKVYSYLVKSPGRHVQRPFQRPWDCTDSRPSDVDSNVLTTSLRRPGASWVSTSLVFVLLPNLC